MNRVVAVSVILSLACACAQARPPRTGPSIDSGGVLVVYIRPFPRQAAPLSVRLEALAAEREDGPVQPLTLLHPDLDGATLLSERRLAFSVLPPGRYSGLRATVSAAYLGGRQGRVPLPVVPEPASVPAAFLIERGRGTVLTLGLDERAVPAPGERFRPAFLGAVPRRPAPGLIAVATGSAPDAVTLFDKISGEVAGIVPAGRGPGGLAVDTERRRAYVASAADDTIETVGLLEQDVLSRVRLRGGDEPADLALTPDGRTLLSANEGSSTVSLIDALSLIETARLPVGNGPKTVLLDRAGRRAYAFNAASSSITVLDVAAGGVAGTIATEAGPLRGQFSRAGDRLYVIHRSSPYLTVIDALTMAVTSRVYVGPGAVALKVDPQTDRIYLARRGGGALEIYDPLSFLPVDTIPTEGDVSFLTIDDEGNNLYLVLKEAGQAQVVRIVSKETTARVDVGDDPERVALLGER